MGARLHARHVPRLEWRHDSPSGEEARVEATFARLAAERKQREARNARGRGGRGAARPARPAGKVWDFACCRIRV